MPNSMQVLGNGVLRAPGLATVPAGGLPNVGDTLVIEDATYVAVQIAGTYGGGSLAFEQSNDGTNWVACPLQNVATVSSAAPTSVSAAAVQAVYAGPVPGLRFRLRRSAVVSSGSQVVTVESYQADSAPPTSQVAQQGAQTPADAYANPTSRAQDTIGLGVAWNGATWDRLRTAVADAMASTGIQAVGQVALNAAGTWDRLRTGGGRTSGTSGLATDEGTLVHVSLNAVTTAVAGTALATTTGKSKHGVQVTGGGATWAVVLEGSLDGTTWFVLGTIDNTNSSGGYLAVADRPVTFVRTRTTAAPAAALTTRHTSTN